MAPLMNVLFNIPDLSIATRCVVRPGEEPVPCTIIGADTTVALKNKDLLDSSNKIAATNLAVNGTIMPIIGAAANGEVLTVNGSSLEFLPPAGGGASDFVKYVSSGNVSAGTGSIDDPFQTITAAVTAWGSEPGITKTIIVLPGEYSENVRLFPDTNLIGSGANVTRIMPTFSIAYSTEVSDYDGAINISDIQTDSIAFNNTTQTGTTASYYFSGLNCSNCTILSDDTTTESIVSIKDSTFSSLNADYAVGTIADVTATNIAMFIRTNASLTGLETQSMDLTGPVDPDIAIISITASNIAAASFTEGLDVVSDAVSQLNWSVGVRATVSPINLNSRFVMDTTSVFCGTTVTGALITRCTAIGADITGIGTESINRTGVGYGATLDADYQVAFSDQARMLKADGLIGHAAATNITYDTVTGRINYATSSAKNKEDITNLCPDRSGLLIDSIVPRKYRWKESGNYAPGLIAEEVEEIVDNLDCESMQDLVARNAKGEVVTVNYTLFIPHLINCIKDLRERIVMLERKLEDQ